MSSSTNFIIINILPHLFHMLPLFGLVLENFKAYYVILLNILQYASLKKDNYSAIITPKINSDPLTVSTVLVSFKSYPMCMI